MNKNVACITGVSGQVGSYLCELLLDKGYFVYGLKRRSSSLNTQRIDHLFDNPNLKLIYGDLTDYASISSFISGTKPELFFNCGAQSHVHVSFSAPLYSFEATGTGVLNCLEAIKQESPKTKFITMSSSEMFGATPPPQSETTPFHPRSPYAVAKLAGYYATINYREMGLFASNAICFNTESPRRGETFLTKKVVRGATRISVGLQKKLSLGNLESARDFTHAKDTVRGLYSIIAAEKPDDYCIASGSMISIRAFVEKVFAKLGMNYLDYVEFDTRLVRPTEVDNLCGSAEKIKANLGWSPEINLEQLVDEMIDHDLKLAKQELLIKQSAT